MPPFVRAVARTAYGDRDVRYMEEKLPQAAIAHMRTKTNDSDDMREEYDFSGGVRGKYAARFAEGSKVVVLDPDVASVFWGLRIGEWRPADVGRNCPEAGQEGYGLTATTV